MAKPENSASDAFIQSLTKHQSHLRAFILGSFGDYVHCEDVLQQTNLILWEKCGDFRQGSEFLPWALAIARFEILAFIHDSQRDRLVFHPDVAKLMTEAAFPKINQVSERQQALRAPSAKENGNSCPLGSGATSGSCMTLTKTARSGTTLPPPIPNG